MTDTIYYSTSKIYYYYYYYYYYYNCFMWLNINFHLVFFFSFFSICSILNFISEKLDFREHNFLGCHSKTWGGWTDGTLGNPTYNFHRNWGHAEHVLVLPWNPSTILFKGIAKSQFSFPRPSMDSHQRI